VNLGLNAIGLGTLSWTVGRGEERKGLHGGKPVGSTLAQPVGRELRVTPIPALVIADDHGRVSCSGDFAVFHHGHLHVTVAPLCSPLGGATMEDDQDAVVAQPGIVVRSHGEATVTATDLPDVRHPATAVAHPWTLLATDIHDSHISLSAPNPETAGR
jgi:hypothetical protein